MTFKVKDGLAVGANTIIDGFGNLTPNGKTTLNNTTTTSGLNLGNGTADPSALVTGDFWNTSGVLKIRQSGGTKTIAYTDSNITGTAANVTGTVATGNGGTGITTTPPAGAIAYGTGSAYAFTAVGSSGYYLTSAGAGVPVWVPLPTTISNATNVAITNDVSALSTSTHYLHFGALTTGNDAVKVSSTRLTFVPSSGNLATIGSVGVGSAGLIISGLTSGTSTIKASDVAGTTTFTLPTIGGAIVTTGDTGTVTSAMIATETIANTDISLTAAIAVSKLAANQISGVTLGGTLFGLTLGTGLTGGTYNGAAAVTASLATSGVTLGSYGSATSIPSITVDTYGRITAASGNTITIGSGTLTTDVSTAGSTNTTVALSLDVSFNANSTANSKIKPVIGPAISALTTIMTGAGTTGILAKTGQDTYGFATNIGTATALQTARTIQGVSFDGSANITFLNAGTGVTVSAPDVTGSTISIGQAVATSSDVRFNSIGVGVVASGVLGTITATSFNGISGFTTTLPLPASGLGSVGSATTAARSDHVHPSVAEASFFYESAKIINTTYTITAGNNAMTPGPITIASGFTVTVPSGSVWTIV